MFEGLDDLLDFVTVTATEASTTRRVVSLSFDGAGDPGDPSTSERVTGVEWVQPLGLLARPVASSHTEALIVRAGDKPFAIAVLDKTGATQAVEAGEARLYGPGDTNATAVVRILSSGAIEVTAKSGQSLTLNVDGAGDLVLDGGSLKVARVTDLVSAGTTMATWITAVSGYINGIAPGTCVPPSDFGTIASTGGATHVKA